MSKVQGKNVWLKRIAIALGGFFALLVVAALVLPLVINIDQYRPQIESMVNQQINGKLSISKLGLSLWGKVEIDVRDTKLVDESGNEIIGFKQAYVLIPFTAILGGKPELNFKLDEPSINIRKDKNGKLNVLSLVKPASTSPAQPPASASPTPDTAGKTSVTPSDSNAKLPGMAFIAAAYINIDILKAAFSYIDDQTKLTQKLNNLDVLIRDISMTRTIKVDIAADVATKMAAIIDLAGPFKLHADITPKFKDIQFESAKVDLKLDASKFDVTLPALVHKKAGLPMGVNLAMNLSTDEVKVDSMQILFHNAVLAASAGVSGLKPPSPDKPSDPIVNFKLASQSIDLAPWNEVIIPLNSYQVQGALMIDAEASGPLSKLTYGANVQAKDFTANVPGLAARPQIQLDVELITNELKKAFVEVTAPETQVSVNTNIKNFAKPDITVTVNSSTLNLDKLLPPSPATSGDTQKSDKNSAANSGASAPGSSATSQSAGSASQQPPLDIDGMLKPLRENEALKGLVTKVIVRMQKIRGMNQEIDDLRLDFELKDLVAAVKNFSLGIFKGKISTSMSLDIKPERPSYNLNLDIAGIDLQNAVEKNMQSLKNTIVGTMSMKANGSGKSLNSDLMIKNLLLKGDFKIADGKFATVDVAQVIMEGVNGSVEKIGSKVPGLGDKKVKTPPNKNMKFKQVYSGFTMENGVVSAPNFVAEALPNESVDIKGNTVAGLLDDTLKAEWNIVDTYNLTKLQDVSIQSNGITVERVLAKGNDPVSFPVIVGCKLSAPCYKYEAIPEHFTRIAMENISNAVKGKAQALLKEQEAKLRAQADALRKQKEDEAKKALQAAQEKAKKEAEEKAKQQMGDKVKDKIKGFKF